MSKSNYTYTVTDKQGRNVIIIQDWGGSTAMSVTNNIENVVAEICAKEKIVSTDYMIVYEDSNGEWDGWDSKNDQFVLLSASSASEAISAYISHQLKTI